MNEFHKNIISQYGDAGQKWLNDLPEIIKRYCQKWNLQNLKPFENLTYNYVVANENVVLKIGFNEKDVEGELKALQHFQMVKILNHDRHAILMERCIPGTTLEHFVPSQDFRATEICIDIVRNIYKPSSQFTTHLSTWLESIYKDHDFQYLPFLEKARKITDDLLASSDENVVLHGDLHHGNILQNGDGYVVIDPKGVVGERLYDIACFIRNPIGLVVQNLDLIPKRIQQFGEALEIDPQRLTKWCFVQGVLSACWRIEDHQDTTDILRYCANIL